MKKISVAIICYNEEKKIERTLKSIDWADEIVIIDSFSTDKTLEICKKYTDKVYQHSFESHIQQKNIALDYCTHDWVFSIDADEVVTQELKQSILQIKNSEDIEEYDGYYVSRIIQYLGKWIKYTQWYPDFKLRLFRKVKAKWGGIDPHDTILLEGKTSRLNGKLLHYSYDDISAHLRTIDLYTSIMSKEYWKRGKKASVINLTLRPLYAIFKSYILKRGFLEGKQGIIISLLDGYYVLLKFAKLMEYDLEKTAITLLNNG